MTLDARVRNPDGTYAAGGPSRNYRMKYTNGKSILLHRVLAERALGKPLPRGAVVHHVDGTKSAQSQLVICQDTAYHELLHVRGRVKAAGGNPNTDRICSFCQQVKPIAHFLPNAANRHRWFCKRCPARTERCRQWRAARREAVA